MLIVDLTFNGGAPRQLLLLAKWLQAFGHKVTIYAYRYNPSRCFPDLTTSLDIRCVDKIEPDWTPARVTLPHRRLFYAAKRHLYESRKLAQLIDDPGDLLNTHTRAANAAALYCKRKTGVPIVWMCNDARNWEHSGYRPYFPPLLQWPVDRVMGYLQKQIVREIDHIVVLDEKVKQVIENFYHRTAQVIRSGIDMRAFGERPECRSKIRERHGIPGDSFLLLWLGILEPHRRIEDVLEAMRRLRQHRDDVRFMIVGLDSVAPHYSQRLRQFVADHHLEGVVSFVFRSVPDEELPDYYSACDAYVYPCENQAWGIAVLEAMACGRPVIVSRAVGVEEVLEDGETALLVPGRNPEAIMRAAAELADHPDLRKKIARQGRQHVERNFSWEKYSAEMLKVFEQACGRKAPREPAGFEREARSAEVGFEHKTHELGKAKSAF